MTGYVLVNLKEMIDKLGEERVKNDFLSNFSCPQNKDVEEFITLKAIEFAKQAIAATHLVFTSYKNETVLVGYFTLANKTFFVSEKATINSNLKKRLQKFAQRNEGSKGYNITAPLVAQLGKNFTNGYNKLITGAELLKIACDKVQEIQQNLGGKVIYLECDDCDKLLEFYRNNGFYCFHKREKDKHEQSKGSPLYLMQLLKYV